MGLRDRLSHAFNVLFDSDNRRSSNRYNGMNYGMASSGFGGNRSTNRVTNDRSIIASIYVRLGIDAASTDIQHVKVDTEDRYLETVKSGLNNCFKVEANIDQSASAFKRDIFMTLFDEGVVAIVPIVVDVNPATTGGYDIKTLRVGKVLDWTAKEVLVKVYNEYTPDGVGKQEEIWLPKSYVSITENPLHAVMNEQNSILKRLIRKLNLLDAVDEAAASGKLDLIVQLPYNIRNETKRNEANQRQKDIELQLKGSKYGIAYIDNSEKITQLNRPAENNMLKQIEYLTNMLYSQLGLTTSIMDGTANEETMLNYFQRTIKPAVEAVVQDLTRTFLTKTARTQGHTVLYFRNPFDFVPLSQLAEIFDKLARNEIGSSNELRQVIGWKPSKDPRADMLLNSNMTGNPQAALPAGTDVSPVTDTGQ